MTRGTGKHEMLVEKIKDRLENSKLFKYMNFCNEEYPHGELDLMSKQGDYLLVFEVKSSFNKRSQAKAHDQLQRAYQYAKKYSDNFRYKKLFFFVVYGGEEGEYEVKRYMPKKI